MTGRSPREIAVATALFCTILATGLHLLITWVTYDHIDIWMTVIFVVACFLGILIIFYKSLQQFIYDKIKLIFRNIHALNVERNTFKFDMGTDVIGEVNKKVVDWAEDRLAEIKILKERETFRKEFVGNVAHELKTPIFSIQGYILTLLEGALEDPNFNRKFLLKAARSVDRMTRIIEDLDTITQFEAGNLKITKEKADIVDLARDVMEAQELEAGKRNIKLKFNKKYDRPIFVKCDTFRISQVLTNLISNSINYGKDGGTTAVSFYDMDEQLLVEVEDDGPGIDPEHLPRLFERFYRVDKSRSRNAGGTGLGLAIVKHIIEAHNQRINVRSEPDKGAVFSFTLEKA